MPIRSMTGFARVARASPFGELTLSIKTVNHRGLDMHFHMPMEFDAVEPALRKAVRQRVLRGHVQVQVHFKRTGAAAGAAIINEPLLRAWLESFRDVAERFEIESKPDLNQALRLPGMMEGGAAPEALDQASLEAETLSAAAEAIEELDAFRLREGEAIETEIRMRAAALRDLVVSHGGYPHAAPSRSFIKRLRDRLGEMLATAQIDPARSPRKRRSSPSAATSAKNWSV